VGRLNLRARLLQKESEKGDRSSGRGLFGSFAHAIPLRRATRK